MWLLIAASMVNITLRIAPLILFLMRYSMALRLRLMWLLHQKDQGASIRPVYVGADNNDEAKPIDAANFAPFRNIVSPMGRKY